MIKDKKKKKFSKAELRDIIAEIKKGNKALRSKFIEANFGLVGMVARRYVSYNFECEEAFQIGCIGLIKAIDGYNLEYDVEFSNYAIPKIAGEIRKFLKDNTSIKIPRGYKELRVKVFYAKESYMNKYGIEPSIEELSQIIEIPKKDISDVIIASKPPISISEPIKRYKDGKEVFFDNIMGTDPDELVNKIIENETVREALDRLTPKEREVILLRYGFEEDKIFPQSEIAKMFNVSQPQIFRIEQKALGKLRLLRTT